MNLGGNMSQHRDKAAPKSLLINTRMHSQGTEKLKSRTLECHYCEHKAIIVFEDTHGHIQSKCKKCGRESIYNVIP